MDSSMLMALLRRVHRRLVALRLLEAAGLGVLGGSLLCLALTPLLVMRGVGLFSAAAVLLPLGVFIGVAWSWSRRPAVADAAGEVDRQLKLDDLLSTAYLLRRRATESSFESAVLTVAEARCATIAPRDLLLRRLGGRAWGGVGLAAALLLAVGGMTANPVETHAASTQRGAARKADAGAQPRPRATASNRYTPAARVARDFPGGEDGVERGGDPAVDERGGDGRPASARDPSITQADPRGSGGGAGRSNDPSRATPNRTEGTGSQRQGGDDAAGGTGVSGDGDGRSGRSGTTAGQVGGRAAPPWAAQGWPSAQAAAEAALRDGRVPAEYHDLVRAYFDR